MAVAYLLICSSEQFDFGFASNRSTAYNFANMVRYSGMTYSDGLAFLNPSKILYKENIVQVSQKKERKFTKKKIFFPHSIREIYWQNSFLHV